MEITTEITKAFLLGTMKLLLVTTICGVNIGGGACFFVTSRSDCMFGNSSFEERIPLTLDAQWTITLIPLLISRLCLECDSSSG